MRCVGESRSPLDMEDFYEENHYLYGTRRFSAYIV